MLLIASIYWNMNPEIFSLGSIHVRWYGLLFALGFIVGFQIMAKIFQTEGKSQKDLEALTIYMIIGTVVGARLGHCLFYEPGFYLSNPIEILKIWNGGLASHGAAIGILIALYFYTKSRPRISYLWILDRVVIVVALAGCFIRMGNFFNSEILGKASNLPWAIIFARVDQVPRHPAQLYESLIYCAIAIYLILRYFRQKSEVPKGVLFGIFLVTVFSARFLIEFIKENQASFESALALNMGQILSIPFIILGVYFILRSKSGGISKAEPQSK